MPICTQGMQGTWWPEASTIIVTGPYCRRCELGECWTWAFRIGVNWVSIAFGTIWGDENWMSIGLLTISTGENWVHTQNTPSAPSHPNQHPIAGERTPMTPMGLVMAGCWQINSILTNIGRRNSIWILNQYPFFWNILIRTQFICFIYIKIFLHFEN